ncbi:mechanosensitive ion channel family protein [Aliikangiella sp. IMCC44632]
MDISSESISNIITNYVIPYSLNFIFAILIFLVGKFVVKNLTKLVGKILTKAKVDPVLVSFTRGIVRSLLMLFVIIAAVGELGVDTTSLVAIVGAAGLAIGLSLQSSLQNFASGVMIITFRPFTAGNFVDIAGVAGTVEKISIFSTILKTGDNKEIIIPNGKIYGDVIINYSAKPTRRVDMVFGIGYDDDLKKAKQIITDILAEDERVLAEPAPLVAVAELADSSVNFNVRPWVNSVDYWSVYYDLHEKIKLKFDAENISIPYPQMDIHMNKLN